MSDNEKSMLKGSNVSLEKFKDYLKEKGLFQQSQVIKIKYTQQPLESFDFGPIVSRIKNERQLKDLEKRRAKSQKQAEYRTRTQQQREETKQKEKEAKLKIKQRIESLGRYGKNQKQALKQQIKSGKFKYDSSKIIFLNKPYAEFMKKTKIYNSFKLYVAQMAQKDPDYYEIKIAGKKYQASGFDLNGY